jgi:hypothetical protein
LKQGVFNKPVFMRTIGEYRTYEVMSRGNLLKIEISFNVDMCVAKPDRALPCPAKGSGRRFAAQDGIV